MAAAWLWVLLYVVAFVVFQLLLYRYLQRSDGSSVERAAPDYGDGEAAPQQLPQTAVEIDDSDRIRCRHCETYNDREASYTFCRECAQRL
jgi:hypothetical protein